MGAILDMTEAWEVYLTEQEVSSLGFTIEKLPTPDYSAPTFDAVTKGVLFMSVD